MDTSRIYRYPNKDLDKHRLWVRFKRIDFEVDGENKMRATSASNQPAVYLYLPGSVELKDGSSYSTEQLGVLGRGTEAVLNRFGIGEIQDPIARLSAATEAISGTAVDAIETAADLVTGADAVNSGMVALMMRRFGGAVPGGVRDGVTSALRTTANPHSRSLFQNVNLRDFSFAFEFMPDNEQEAVQQQEIIHFFRKLAYPTLYSFEGTEIRGIDANLANQLVYKFPSMVQVDMMYRMEESSLKSLESISQFEGVELEDLFNTLGQDGDEVMSSGMWRVGPKIQPCYVTTVSQSLDNNNSMTYRPIEITSNGEKRNIAVPTTQTLTISLQEDRPLSSESIDEGY
jgi:hypothetical protein